MKLIKNEIDFSSEKPFFADPKDEEIYDNVIYFIDGLTSFDIETEKSFGVIQGRGFFARLDSIIKEWKRWEKEFDSPNDTKKMAEAMITQRVKTYFPKGNMIDGEYGFLLAEDFGNGKKSYSQLATIKSDFLMKKSEGAKVSGDWFTSL